MDRNQVRIVARGLLQQSLSARRAWIEIRAKLLRMYHIIESLSARRAWIEIPPVDTSSVNVSGRSPQGERG